MAFPCWKWVTIRFHRWRLGLLSSPRWPWARNNKLNSHSARPSHSSASTSRIKVCAASWCLFCLTCFVFLCPSAHFDCHDLYLRWFLACLAAWVQFSIVAHHPNRFYGILGSLSSNPLHLSPLLSPFLSGGLEQNSDAGEFDRDWVCQHGRAVGNGQTDVIVARRSASGLTARSSRANCRVVTRLWTVFLCTSTVFHHRLLHACNSIIESWNRIKSTCTFFVIIIFVNSCSERFVQAIWWTIQYLVPFSSTLFFCNPVPILQNGRFWACSSS